MLITPAAPPALPSGTLSATSTTWRCPEEQGSGEPAAPLTDASDELRSKMKLNELCHADAVTDLLLAEAGSSKVLLSCSRDGCIKAWK